MFLLSTASAQIPNLQPRVLLPEEAVGSSFWLYAPDIAVVHVSGAELLGREIEVTPPQKTVVRLVRIDGEVENVIRGELPKGRVRFYFFVNVPSKNGYSTPRYWLRTGSRYIVFLREDGGYLRTMADVTAPEIPVLTGPHDQLVAPGDGSLPPDPRMEILVATLVPTAEYDPAFAATIPRTESVIREFVRPVDTALVLRGLLAHPDPDIQAQACLVLARRFRYRDPCLLKLIESKDERVRGQAGIWMTGRTEGGKELLRALKEDPLSLSISREVEDLPGEIGLLTFDWDPEVRHQACMTLHLLSPADETAWCAGSSTK